MGVVSNVAICNPARVAAFRARRAGLLTGQSDYRDSLIEYRTLIVIIVITGIGAYGTSRLSVGFITGIWSRALWNECPVKKEMCSW